MSDTLQMLLARRQELADQLPAMSAAFNKLRQELVAMQATFNATANELEAIDEAIKKLEQAGSSTEHVTIMQAVLAVLEHKPNGMTALEILDEINAKYFNGTIVRTSLSPQLSRLKNRYEKIELRGNRWYRLPEEPMLFNRRV
jgi:chromosome segregation ATPase